MFEVIWFRNAHEHRNDWLRFGFMRQHCRGILRYRELPLARCVEFGFSAGVATHVHRHTSVVLLSSAELTAHCLIDSEDSLYGLCPLIAEVDLYFCAGFNRTFFEGRLMPAPYRWQSEPEVAFYRAKANELIRDFGRHFHKARAFSPIGPNLASKLRPGFLAERLRNLRHRVASRTSGDIYWRNDLEDFERRYRELINLRRSPLLYDVVLLDTLWGWPRHRVALHRRLGELAGAYKIHSRLNWSAPVPFDGSELAPLSPELFPMKTGAIADYEEMLASSRLAVFATGFHWGWRNIVTLALMVGLPILMDAPIAEPWFEWSEFAISWNSDEDWTDLEGRLQALNETEWLRIKAHNQAAFDRLIAPERVAQYVLEAASGTGSSGSDKSMPSLRIDLAELGG